LDAARHGNVAIMRELLDRRVDINHANKKGETALIRACERGLLSSVMLLLDRGADMTKVTKEKRNALIVGM
jgi:ankyrin repeat protein